MDASSFKTLMSRVPAPVTVVTTRDAEQPAGATVSSFASLSLEPPLISIALIAASALLAQIRKAQRFAVNVLAHDQAEIALTFAAQAETRFSSASWIWRDGLPRLHGVASFVVCDVWQDVAAGDHALLFGMVRDCDTTEAAPLVYTARQFGTHSRLIADRAPDLAAQLRAFTH
jgi:flavin reductase (DIM6/NTAB) family NADH-FMN oxidoreductase RutF